MMINRRFHVNLMWKLLGSTGPNPRRPGKKRNVKDGDGEEKKKMATDGGGHRKKGGGDLKTQDRVMEEEEIKVAEGLGSV